MKAVIMAGGQGSRLRPLTCEIPKPMVRIFGKPVIEYILELLGKNGVDSAVVTLGYLPDVITSHFESGSFGGVKLDFSVEEKPMGTAGSVRLALDNYDETFIVISGDAICDFELDKAVKYHKAAGAKVTIIGKQVDDPREYGLLQKDDENRVKGFLEKPSWGQAVTDLANTGIYIIEPDVLSLIPESGSYDFAKDLFPKMLGADLPVFCYKAEGYWCDIGDTRAYMQCHWDLLDGKAKIDIKSAANGSFYLDEDSAQPGSFTINPPVYIGEQTDIGKGAIIGPYACIDNECLIGEGAKIRSSLMLKGSGAAALSSMNGAVLGTRATLKRGANMFEDSVMGAGSCAGVGSVIKHGVLVWPEKNIESYTIVNGNVKYGVKSKDIFDDSGIGGDLGIELTPETCASIGAGIGSVKACKKAGIACDGSNSSKAMMLAIISGMMSSGSRVWTFGECFEAQLSFFTTFCGLGIGIFVSGGDETQIKICGEGGLSIPRFLEREIESRVSRCEFNRCSGETCRDVADMSSIRMMYSRELLRQAPYELKGMSANVVSSNDKIVRLMRDCLKKLGCDSGEELTLRFNRAGTRLNVISDECGTVGFEKLLAVCCYNEMNNGGDVALPFDAPLVLDSLALSCGKKAYRYLSSPSDSSDSPARRLAAKQIWVRDALFMAVRLLSIMKEREKSLKELLCELPDFETAKKTFAIQFSPAKLADFLGENECSESTAREGILLKKENGRLLITPSRSGKSINVLAEADTMETAAELCDGIEKLLAKGNK